MISLPGISVVLFDFDGTLCRTEEDLRTAWKNVLLLNNCQCPDFDRIFRIGPTLLQITREIFPDRDETFHKKILDDFGRCYDTSGFPETAPYPGVEAWLKNLKTEGKRLFIVTNKRMNPMRILMQKLLWNGLFEDVYTPDMTPGTNRNKAELIRFLLQKYHFQQDHVLMVGDTAGDVSAGKNNGVKTAGVLWGYGTPDELKDADFILSFHRFLSSIRKI